ncbi:hypothetical protein VNO77_33475 [Canavalia gladiata]|uniref:DUF4378 domain-containing protein n=1 Tax=Canavalia gladiata TaxID=3824 RepID=A0AAN9Q0R3_CANGL
MGKEWYWTGRSSKRGGGVEGTETQTQTPSSGCMCAVFQFFDFHPFHFPTMNHHHQHDSFKPPSCLQEDPVTTVPKGAEAPRNSLESEDGNDTVSSSLSKEENFKIPKNIMQIKTSGSRRTSGSSGNLNDLSSEISNSPGTKTPTLVARLMGLDLLPGAHSPSSSSSSSSCLSTPNPQGNVPHLHHLRPKQHIQTKHRNSIDSSDIAAVTRSLPETPKISTARRSDVDHYHHRLSLQINKDNMNLGEDLELHRFSFSKRKCDENNTSSKSPSHYARQIVKQVKESVSRKVGQDITNTLKTREQEKKEEPVGQFRSKKCTKTSLKAIDETSQGKHLNQSLSSYSPRLRFIDTKNKPNTTTTTTTRTTSPLSSKDQNMLKIATPPPQVNTQLQLPRVLTKPKPQALLAEQQEETQYKKSVPKCKKVTNERFNSRFKRPPQTSDIIRNKQEETFVIRQTSPTTRVSDTKSKKTHPLSTNLLNNINTVPNLLPVKTDPSPPSTKIPSKQSQVSDSKESKSSTQLSSCSRQRYKQEGTSTLATREISNGSENKLNGASTTVAEHHTPQFQYITRILTKEGTTNTTATATATWFSPTHPLDPSLFHQLEHSNNHKDSVFSPKNQLGHRWNRRLTFDLVDEVLKEILKPKGNEKRLWFLKGNYGYQGKIEGLIERVWKRVEEFPRAKCEVLEDIDGLIEMVESEDENNGIEEEGEGLVAEIEGNIWDTLVHETVMVMDCYGGGSGVHVIA